jgi:tetratricopeptide (TPR) repeat protein
VGEDLDLPDEVYGFGSWLLWVLATRATDVVDRAFAVGPARPSRHYGTVDGHPVPTPSLVAWLLTAAECGVAPEALAGREPRLDERQKVLRTIVSRAVGGEPRLFKDGWLRQLSTLCGLGDPELQFLLRSRDDEGYAVDPAALRKAIAQTMRARPADGSPAPGMPAGGTAAATRTLPRDIASFTGREPELAQLAAAAVATGSGGVVAICAVGGMAGVGKTAFAVHAAHQLAARFPDGQVFLPLHGHTPGHQPVDPADALASLLQISGVAAAQIPPGLEARMALWRDRLAGQHLLLLLDDAAGHEQVRPLLPGTAGSLVLVTSRRHLTALEDAQPVSLDTLPPDQAARLLSRLAARPGLDPADPAVSEITRLCGCLPLAVGMLARQLHHHPAWTPAELVADLAAARDRLELMAAENLSVAAAFDLSYADLTAGQQRLFRHLGLHPGTDVDAYAAAALDGTDLATARRHLDDLYDQYLLTEPAHGRYRLHDLIREHARGKAAADPAAETDAALGRLLDYYEHAAAIAEARLARQSRTRPGQAAVTARSAVVPGLPDRARALSWARAERANLLACLDHATGADQYARIVAFTAAIAALLRQDGPWTDAIARHAAALQAARHLGDKPGEANALSNLGILRRLTGDYRGAAEALEEALGIYRDLDDRLGQASTLNELGVVLSAIGDYRAAAEAREEALDIYRDLGDRLGQANALSDIGAGQYTTGDYRGAAEALEEALDIYRDLGDRLGQAAALTHLGGVRRQTGDYRGAAGALEEALSVYHDLGDRLGQANALSYLGNVREHTGEFSGAAEALEEALGIYRDLGDRLGQGGALSCLGNVREHTGDYRGAAEALEEALSICRDLGHRGGEAEVLNQLGTLHRVRGDLDHAEMLHRQALDVAREIDGSWDEAHALAGLGRCALAGGRTTDAETGLRQALEIFQRIGAAEATGVAAELNAVLPARKVRSSKR